MIKVFPIFLIIFLLFSVNFAQETNAVSPKKVAFINNFAFGNEKTGIKKLVDAWRFNPGFIGEKDEQRRSEIYKRICEKHEKEVIEPILKEISGELKKVETQNNIIILDAPELDEKGYILGVDFKFDITEKFTNYFNNKSKTKDENLILDIPESKIGVINLDLLFDKQNGIKNFKNSGINSTKFCSDEIFCKEFLKSTQSYTLRNGFSFIFDSSKNLPEEISKLVDKDVTQDFINNFNNKIIKE